MEFKISHSGVRLERCCTDASAGSLHQFLTEPITRLAVRSSVIRIKLHCPVKVCNKLSNSSSVVGCAVAKKLKHRRVGEKKFELLFGVKKKILSCKLWFKRWLKRLARVYFFVRWLFIVN